MAEAVIGEGVRVEGQVSADKELTILGSVSGKIRSFSVSIRAGGAIEADVEAARVVVFGQAAGNIVATEKIELKSTARVVGDLSAPSVVIEEGAVIRGSVKMDVDLPDDV